MLAAIEAPEAALILSAITLLASVINGIMTTILAGKTRRIENLESRFEDKAEELVDAKLEARTGGIRASLEVLASEVRRINERLGRGDADFKDLNERDHALELKFSNRVDALKDFIRETCATKADLEKLNDRFTALQIAVAKDLAEKVAAKGAKL